MRNRALIVVGIIILVLGSVVVYRDFRHFRQRELAKAAEVQRQANDLQAKQESLEQQLTTRVNELYTECQKGVKAYQLTTAAQRKDKQLSEPYCGQPIVE